eukprot:1006347_1
MATNYAWRDPRNDNDMRWVDLSTQPGHVARRHLPSESNNISSPLVSTSEHIDLISLADSDMSCSTSTTFVPDSEFIRDSERLSVQRRSSPPPFPSFSRQHPDVYRSQSQRASQENTHQRQQLFRASNSDVQHSHTQRGYRGRNAHGNGQCRRYRGRNHRRRGGGQKRCFKGKNCTKQNCCFRHSCIYGSECKDCICRSAHPGDALWVPVSQRSASHNQRHHPTSQTHITPDIHTKINSIRRQFAYLYQNQQHQTPSHPTIESRFRDYVQLLNQTIQSVLQDEVSRMDLSKMDIYQLCCIRYLARYLLFSCEKIIEMLKHKKRTLTAQFHQKRLFTCTAK